MATVGTGGGRGPLPDPTGHIPKYSSAARPNLGTRVENTLIGGERAVKNALGRAGSWFMNEEAARNRAMHQQIVRYEHRNDPVYTVTQEQQVRRLHANAVADGKLTVQEAEQRLRGLGLQPRTYLPPPFPSQPFPFRSLWPPGMVAQGNIDLARRPIVRNPNGSISTVRSIGIGTPLGETVIPTVVGPRVVSNQQAIAQYNRTGQQLGSFRTVPQADRFATQLHGSLAALMQASRLAR